MASLAMSFAMQESMQENQDVKPEVSGVEEDVVHAQDAPEEVEVSQEPADESSVEGEFETVAEAELDPWEQLELEVAKWKDQAIRTAAELDNYRKRMSREKLDAVRYGNQRLLEELLPVLDNFDMGMQAASKEQGSMLYMGMEMVHKQIAEFLTSQGVDEIPATEGGDFDPNLHEAISQEASVEVESEKIVRIIRKGYKMGERLLRPSNVIVSLGEKVEEESTDSE